MYSSEQRRLFIINNEKDIISDLNRLSYDDFFDKYKDVFVRYHLPSYDSDHKKAIINSIILTKIDLTDAKLSKFLGLHQGTIYNYRRGKVIKYELREQINEKLANVLTNPILL